MKKLLIAVASALMLVGCAAPPPAPAPYQPSQISTEQIQQRAKITQDLEDGKKRLAQLQQQLGRFTSPVDGAAIRADIEEQQKQIEALEAKLAGMPAVDYSGSRASGGSSAPCVTSYCGPVNVRGYYRKDGTYVRPHTRSRGKR